MEEDMNDYTPSTERGRDTWTNAMSEGCASAEELADAMWDTERRDAQFDRWLAAHDAEVRANAIREAAEFIQPWNYDRPDDWTEIARAEASSADALRVLAGSVAEEPEWEYGVESRFEESDEAYDAVEWGSREQAEAVARDQNEEEAHEDGYVRLVYSVVKRVPAVPAGPWVPVKQEGATDA